VITVFKPTSAVPARFRIAARDELKNILAHFRSSRKRKRQFKFTAYRHPELKQELEKLFNGKCAYCEWRYGGGSYLEVEHYRPKSHYYWLATEWSNLLPSCKRCNNGKLSVFPLIDPSRQAQRKGQERHERPLLLNPADPKSRPQDHLTFNTIDGSIKPVVDARGQASLLGKTSISVYRLDRAALSLERKEWVIRVRDKIQISRNARSQKAHEEGYQGLKSLLAAHQPFQALTRQVLRANGFG
jgi:uncharacterized protein (TIGR02646 family)